MYVYDSSIQLGDISHYEREKIDSLATLITFSENHTFYKLTGPCSKRRLKLKNIKADERMKLFFPVVSAYSVSIISLLIIFILYLCNARLKRGPMRKYWLIYSTLSICNYLNVVLIGFILIQGRQAIFNEYIFILNVLYLFLELSVYIWLIVISLELYLTLK